MLNRELPCGLSCIYDAFVSRQRRDLACLCQPPSEGLDPLGRGHNSVRELVLMPMVARLNPWPQRAWGSNTYDLDAEGLID